MDAVEADEAQRLLDSFNRAQNMGGMGSAPAVRRARLADSRRSLASTVDQILDCLNREQTRATDGGSG